MVIAVASDHGGFKLKLAVKEHLIERGYKVVEVAAGSKSAAAPESEFPLLRTK